MTYIIEGEPGADGNFGNRRAQMMAFGAGALLSPAILGSSLRRVAASLFTPNGAGGCGPDLPSDSKDPRTRFTRSLAMTPKGLLTGHDGSEPNVFLITPQGVEACGSPNFKLGGLVNDLGYNPETDEVDVVTDRVLQKKNRQIRIICL